MNNNIHIAKNTSQSEKFYHILFLKIRLKIQKTLLTIWQIIIV